MSANEEVVIISAVRTPIGSFCGSLSSLKGHELGSIVIEEAIRRANVDHNDVSEVIFGHVLTAGQGQNPARQAAMKAGIPHTVPATTVNMLCGSGLRTVMLGAQAIKAGDSEIVVVGGQESMSQAQHSAYLRSGLKLGDGSLADTLLTDGLIDAFHRIHMGITAENIVRQNGISREAQDKYSLQSQQKTAVAQTQGFFNEEIVPVNLTGRKAITVSTDEFPRNDTTIEGLKKLKPCFKHDGTGTVTAGNASGINDGASALLLASKSVAQAKGLRPLARVVSSAIVGVDPTIMGTGPIPAVQAALKKAGWTISEVDYFELNEAFAAQSIAVAGDLQIPASKINVRGGAISLGHPIGASGARILVTLIHILKQNNKTKGVAALCIGGGQGIAMCIEAIN